MPNDKFFKFNNMFTVLKREFKLKKLMNMKVQKAKSSQLNKIDLTKIQNEEKTDYAGIEELWKNEKLLNNYNRDIVHKLSKFSTQNSKVLEFGAGLGTLAKLWQSEKNNKPECLEIDASLRKLLLGRGFLCHKTLEEINKTYDLIYTSNVLEHIKDDVSVLKKLNKKIKVNGCLAIYVPAFMFLYNHLDSSVGHYRRYEKKELIEKLLLANFRIKECYYSDSIGFFTWLFVRSKGTDSKLKFYDKFIYPFSNLLDSTGFKYLFGKNLIVIAQKQ